MSHIDDVGSALAALQGVGDPGHGDIGVAVEQLLQGLYVGATRLQGHGQAFAFEQIQILGHIEAGELGLGKPAQLHPQGLCVGSLNPGHALLSQAQLQHQQADAKQGPEPSAGLCGQRWSGVLRSSSHRDGRFVGVALQA